MNCLEDPEKDIYTGDPDVPTPDTSGGRLLEAEERFKCTFSAVGKVLHYKALDVGSIPAEGKFLELKIGPMLGPL